MRTLIARAFHDWRNKGYFVDNNRGLFFVSDKERDRVGYDPVQAGLLPVTKGRLKSLLAIDTDGWTRSNLKRLGYDV